MRCSDGAAPRKERRGQACLPDPHALSSATLQLRRHGEPHAYVCHADAPRRRSLACHGRDPRNCPQVGAGVARARPHAAVLSTVRAHSLFASLLSAGWATWSQARHGSTFGSTKVWSRQAPPPPPPPVVPASGRNGNDGAPPSFTGFTVFCERKIAGHLHGEPQRHMEHISGATPGWCCDSKRGRATAAAIPPWPVCHVYGDTFFSYQGSRHWRMPSMSLAPITPLRHCKPLTLPVSTTKREPLSPHSLSSFPLLKAAEDWCWR